MIAIILAILPVFLIGLYCYKKDTVKEPKAIIRKLLLGGILSGVFVIIFSLIIFTFFPSLTNHEELNLIGIFFYSFIFVALTEEAFKLLIIYKFSYNDKEFNQAYDIMLYSIFVGLGFALFENIIYVLGNANGILTAITRAFTAVPAHACLQTFMGYYLYLAKVTPTKKKYYFRLSLIIPMLMHGLYDFLILSGNINLIILDFIFLLSILIISVIKIKKLVNFDKSIIKKYNNICPNCNIQINSNFCPKCGHKK